LFPVPYLNSFLRSQFGKPSGWFGSLFLAPLLNAANTGLIRTTIDLLDPKPGDAVLDIGFGGGYSLTYLAQKVTGGRIIGVDYSREMVDTALALLKSRHLESRVKVRQGDVGDLPFRERTFDKAVSVNAIYYWPDAVGAFREIARVLKVSGEIAIGLRSPASLRLVTAGWRDFALYEPWEVARMMEQAGLRVQKVEHGDRRQMLDSIVVTGQRPPRRTARKKRTC
jgi:ubiquinone/menaquinone biosynthesis C-methylase UbiE